MNRSSFRFLALLPIATVLACQSGGPSPASADPSPALEASEPEPAQSTPESSPPPAARPTTPEPATPEPATPEPAAPAPAASAVSDDDASTLDGVYTTAQAARGAQVFEAICSECHNTEEWQDQGFRDRWHDESVFRFWYYIYEQMPNGAPPYTLTREQVTDVVTYILELNGLPVGAAELGSDDDSIDKYWLRWMPSE